MKNVEYKFRAECWIDVARFLTALVQCFAVSTFNVTRDARHPDCVATVSTTCTRDELVEMANSIPDCHVIAETIQPTAEYTGIR